MKSLRHIAYALACLCAFLSDARSAPPIMTPDELTGQIAQLLNAKDYAGLDQFYQQLRTTKCRMRSGDWCSDSFFIHLYWLPQLREPQAQMASFGAWKRNSPTSVAARIGLANVYLNRAWKVRGDGFADTVTSEGWKGFNENVNHADIELLEAKRLSPDNLETLTALLNIEHLLGSDSEQTWATFRAVQKLEPEYFKAYYIQYNYLLPRWGGQPGETLRFVEDSTRQTHDQLGDGIYFLLVYKSTRYENQGIFNPGKFDWTRVKQGFADMDRRYPGSLALPTKMCYLAMLANDRQTAAQMLNRVGTQWDGMKQEMFYGNRSWYEQYLRYLGM